jgi:hypothetical protein
MTRAHRELDVACLKAMVPLLDGFVLRTSDSIDGKTNGGRTPTDPKELRRLVDFFTLLLQRISVTEESFLHFSVVLVSLCLTIYLQALAEERKHTVHGVTKVCHIGHTVF